MYLTPCHLRLKYNATTADSFQYENRAIAKNGSGTGSLPPLSLVLQRVRSGIYLQNGSKKTMIMSVLIETLKMGLLFLKGTILVKYFLVTGQLKEA